MITAVVAAMALLGLLGVSFTAYQINHKARLRDNARAVLRSYVDQFQQLSYSTKDDITRVLFVPTGSPTGLGLIPTNEGFSDLIDDPDLPTNLEVDIGPLGTSVTATVTRDVQYVAGGSDSVARSANSAGFMLRATFEISYTVPTSPGTPIKHSVTVLRLVGG